MEMETFFNKKQELNFKQMITLPAKYVAGITLFFIFFSIILYIVYSTDSYPYKVDKESCTCDCFDRKIKGHYFTAHKQYKFIYPNSEPETIVLIYWMSLMGTYFVCLLMRVMDLTMEGQLDIFSVIQIPFFYYQNSYNCWMFFNYVNDEYYELFFTQLFFTITELIPSLANYYLLDKRVKVPPLLVIASQSVAMCHLINALIDQSFLNIFFVTKKSVLFRDYMMIISDGTVWFCFWYHIEKIDKKGWQIQAAIAFTLFCIYQIIKASFGYF